MHPAIFLDRDGVIIENRAAHVRSWKDVEIYPQALQALRLASELPHKIIIVTNQSAVGRGIISLSEAQGINDQLVGAIVEADGRIDGVFMCPHAPHEGCSCRKPEPGLLFQAGDSLALDLERSIMIGDTLSDLGAGQAAGLKQLMLVRTGRGVEQAQIRGPDVDQLRPFVFCDNLLQAILELRNLGFV